MCDVFCRHSSNGCRKVVKDFCKQLVIDVHMDRLPRIDIPDPLERQRNAGRIEVGVETCGSLESTDVELVGVFEGNLCFVRYRFCHLVSSSLKSTHSISVVEVPAANVQRP